MARHFTLQEAKETLTTVRPMIEEMMAIAGIIRAHQPEIWSVVEKSAGDGGNPALSKIVPDFDRLDALLHRIEDMGIEVKDMTIGFVDFPALRDGSEVYLCWKYGEDDIQFWHEIEAGFAGRQPIEDF